MTAVNTGDIRLWVEANSLPASVRAQVLALCDALDATRTERDSWQADVERLHGDLAHSMDRIAEEMAALEAERERVRQSNAVLAELWEYAKGLEGALSPFAITRSYVTFPECAPDLMARIVAALATASGQVTNG